MLPAANRGAGQNMGFPDVCNTPVGPATVPIPYPNIAMNAQAVGFSQVVKVSMVNALNMASQIPMTSGDEAGTAHPMIKQAGKYTMGCPLVFIDKQPAITLTMPTTGNNMNNALGAVTVPSATNVMMCWRRAVDDGELATIADELVADSVVEATRLAQGVGHVRLGTIGHGAAASFRAALRRIGGEPLTAVILDLRGCPGGSFSDAVALVEDLLPCDAPIADVEENGERTVVRARREAALSVPLVVMIDRRTASAAELIAGALHDNARALLVGERSYGKPYAYRIVDVDGGPKRVTALRWHRAHPRVTPDVPLAGEAAQALRHAWMVALQIANT